MRKTQRHTVTLTLMLVGALFISSCQISLSQAPQGSPTPIPTGFFTTPNSGGLSIQTIAAFGTQTAAARTAGPGTGTPATLAASPTPVIVTMTPTAGTPGTPTNALVTIPVATTAVSIASTPGGPTATALAPGIIPTTYTLQSGEFAYCLARRFNVDVTELLSLNGIAPEDLLMPGTTLKIPQGGKAYQGTRALRAHPDTYTVASSAETVYGVACKYGDVYPSAIAQQNGISVSAALSVGQQLKIP